MEKEITSSIYQIDKIGNKAQMIDTELTILERMKLRRSTLNRIGIAVTFYFIVMGIFVNIL
jgi:hypothetical protein